MVLTQVRTQLVDVSKQVTSATKVLVVGAVVYGAYTLGELPHLTVKEIVWAVGMYAAAYLALRFVK